MGNIMFLNSLGILPTHTYNLFERFSNNYQTRFMLQLFIYENKW